MLQATQVVEATQEMSLALSLDPSFATDTDTVVPAPWRSGSFSFLKNRPYNRTLHTVHDNGGGNEDDDDNIASDGTSLVLELDQEAVAVPEAGFPATQAAICNKFVDDLGYFDDSGGSDLHHAQTASENVVSDVVPLSPLSRPSKDDVTVTAADPDPYSMESQDTQPCSPSRLLQITDETLQIIKPSRKRAANGECEDANATIKRQRGGSKDDVDFKSRMDEVAFFWLCNRGATPTQLAELQKVLKISACEAEACFQRLLAQNRVQVEPVFASAATTAANSKSSSPPYLAMYAPEWCYFRHSYSFATAMEIARDALDHDTSLVVLTACKMKT